MHRIVTLKTRPDYVYAATNGHKYVCHAMVVQAVHRRDAAISDTGEVRVGFTATKKLGHAVIRNRVKRRLRAAADQVLPRCGVPGVDYVLIGRRFCVQSPFDALCKDLEKAVMYLNHKLR